MNYDLEAARLKKDWAENPRWKGIKRGYSAEDVVRLRGSVHIEHTLARRGAEKLWKLDQRRAVRQHAWRADRQSGAAAGEGRASRPIYLSGWQVAADANIAGEMYPDQSLYPVNSVPMVVRRINNAFMRADQIQHMEGKGDIDFFAPIVADAEAGFGGVLNAFELMKSMIEAGAAGVHFEDQLAAVKKCGHMGGKVLVPTREAVEKLVAARLAADCMGVPTIVLARTDAEAADLLTSDIDDNDKPFCTGERTVEGFYKTRAGFEQSVSRGLAYAAYADLIWCETGKPDLDFAKRFAEAIQAEYPGQDARVQLLAVVQLEEEPRRRARSRGSSASWARWATSSSSSRSRASTASTTRCSISPTAMRNNNMSAFVELQEAEFAAAEKGFTAVRHQREVGTGYFDAVTTTVQGSQSSTTALEPLDRG